nr:MAG TPA: hypothetical protein [Caudoviricetes sp.]
MGLFYTWFLISKNTPIFIFYFYDTKYDTIAKSISIIADF